MPRNLYLEELNAQIYRTEMEITNLRSRARMEDARGNRPLARECRAKANRLVEDLGARKAARDEEMAARPGVAS